MQNRKDNSMTGKRFHLKKSIDGQYMFNLHAENGEIIATSELYKSKQAALNGIQSVRDNGPDAPLDDDC